MTFEQTNEKQRQRMKADARSHMEAARMILASPLYARLKGGEDLYTAVCCGNHSPARDCRT